MHYPSKKWFMLVAFATLFGSVSAQTEFGINYWPYGQASECLNDSQWPTNKPIIEADLDHISSLGCSVVRIAFWPHESSWHIGWPRDPEYYQQTGRMEEFLELFHDRDMTVIVTFPKEYASNLYGPAWIEHYGDTPEGFEDFLQDSADWVNGFIDAIEASPYKDTVLFYDLVPEYEEEDLYLGAYAQAMYDRSHAPAGKRGISVLTWEPWTGNHDTNLIHLAQALSEGGSRPLDFVDVHSYPSASDDLIIEYPWAYPFPDLETMYNMAEAVFSNAIVVVGESGHSAPDNTEEQEQQDVVLALATQAMNLGIKYHLGWMFWDDTPNPPNQEFGWGDNPHTPKDVMGGLSALLGSLYNPDMEILDGGAPDSWSAGGTVQTSLTAKGPGDTASNNYYARLQAATLGPPSGDVWMVSPATVVHGGTLYFNSYIRSNLINVRMVIFEYDQDDIEIRRTEGASFNPAWAWNNYLQHTGSFSVDLLPASATVRITIEGSIVENISYLDVDTVSLFEKRMGPTESYMVWAAGYGLVNTNGTGGNPTNGNDQGNAPASQIVSAGGTTGLNMSTSNIPTKTHWD